MQGVQLHIHVDIVSSDGSHTVVKSSILGISNTDRLGFFMSYFPI